MNIFEKSIMEYFRSLKYFFMAIFAIAVVQIFLSSPGDKLFDLKSIVIMVVKFVTVFVTGFYATKIHKFDLRQVAFSGFLLYFVILWLQPVVSLMALADYPDFIYLAIWTFVMMIVGLVAFIITAVIGGLIGTKL